MKILKIFCLVILVSIQATYAQNVKKNKDAVQEAAIKKLIDSKSYTFLAQSVTPLRGRNFSLSYGYDLRVNKDTIVAYLPFFGRAFVAPIDPTDNGIEFTSTKFTYKSVAKKNGYLITIQPADTKDVRQMFLDVSSNGYASLRIINLNRDAISFNGYLEPLKKTD
jgi:hypothetical protein